jgi:hypothetical protein
MYDVFGTPLKDYIYMGNRLLDWFQPWYFRYGSPPHPFFIDAIRQKH